MKIINILLLCALSGTQPSKPMDKVNQYAEAHQDTVHVTLWHGIYWVEMDKSDAFGIGKTPEQAAESFLIDADLKDNEKNVPQLRRAEDEPKNTQSAPCKPTEKCI